MSEFILHSSQEVSRSPDSPTKTEDVPVSAHSGGRATPLDYPIQFSGRYTYRGNIRADQLTASTPRSNADPKAPGDHAVFSIAPSTGDLFWFTLHVDIDGSGPLNIVSGTLGRGESLTQVVHFHFIGRVRTNKLTAIGRALVVEDFNVAWPGSNAQINRLELSLYHSVSTGTWVAVTFHDTLQNLAYGPFNAIQESLWFREVEIDVAVETGAAEVEPYNTHTHPDRPAKLPEETMTIESAFAKAGIRIIRSLGSGYIIDTREAGEDGRWSMLELHDSMQLHWDAFVNKPQWKLWLFFACLSEHERMGGAMFDCDINDPGGVDRQGVAIFTRCQYFYSTDGGYIMMNPPSEAAVSRELFFNTIHEMGHAFNLAHPFERTAGRPWKPPPWMRGRGSTRTVTWMNYPDRPMRYVSGANATWFYRHFTFQFDKHELLFLRHAPELCVEMGGEAWYRNHGRVALSNIDGRLRLSLRLGKDTYELGEPILIELLLGNISDRPVLVHLNLDPSDGMVEFSITDPDGVQRPHVPIIRTRVYLEQHVLEPGGTLPYASVNLTVGALGFPFKKPGAYRIEVRYTNLDGGITAAAIQLYVRPPADPDVVRVVNALFDARVGRVLYVGGTRVLEDVNNKLDWVRNRLGMRHPISMHLAAVRFKPLTQSTKLIVPGASCLQTLSPEPDRVVEHLASVVIEQPHVALETMGSIHFRDVVDMFTHSAMEAGAQRLALQAQERLLGIFKSRDVLPSTVAAIEARLVALRRSMNGAARGASKTGGQRYIERHQSVVVTEQSRASHER